MGENILGFSHEQAIRVHEEVGQQFMVVGKKFDKLDQQFGEVFKRFDKVGGCFEAIEQCFASVKQCVDSIDADLILADKRFDRSDKNFSHVDKHFDTIDEFFTPVRKCVAHIDERLNDIENCLDEGVETHFDRVKDKLDTIDRSLNEVTLRLDASDFNWLARLQNSYANHPKSPLSPLRALENEPIPDFPETRAAFDAFASPLQYPPPC
ncbi:hypothetical protein HOY80DRAFT_1081848 [Tuber brumale]|nr:hypothetical protein HOY80DRAFT_1081848 [Tuber brumale]